MSVTAERRTGRPPGLEASTMAEAFQLTVGAHPERVALRLKDDGMTMPWREYGDKVRALTAGLAGLGLEPGSTLGIMLTNRPSSTGSTPPRCTPAPRRSRSTTPTRASRSSTR